MSATPLPSRSFRHPRLAVEIQPSPKKMYLKPVLALLSATIAYASAQGEGLGYPPPPPQTLESTKSGVLVRLPTSSAAFEGLEINEGAIVHDAMPDPT